MKINEIFWSLLTIGLMVFAYHFGKGVQLAQVKDACQNHKGIMADGFVLQCNVITMKD